MRSFKSLSELFSYCHETGNLVWNINRPRRKAGSEAGNIKSDGRYKTVHATINGVKKRYYNHRVIWEIVNGELPEGMCIDHIDGDGLNNKLNNLRLVTRSQNQRNKKHHSNNTSGEMCIFVNHVGSFVVNVMGKNRGSYKSMKEAITARDKVFKEMKFHANHGRKAA